MRTRLALLMAGLALATTGCATTGAAPGTDVTRYHLGTPIGRGTIMVEPATGADAVSLEYRSYLDAVHGQLIGLGFTDPAPGAMAQYVASVSMRRYAKGVVREPSPFRIGLGGGSYGGGVGVGGGVSLPIGRSKTRDIVDSELAVQIRDRSTANAVWEGRAVTETLERGPGGAPPPAGQLADALFRGFPGESGITTTVR